MSTISELVIELAKERRQCEEIQVTINPRFEKLKEELKTLQQPVVLSGERIRKIEDQIRIEVVKQHSLTGETKYDGVTVKHFVVVTITDEREAKVWAAHNIPNMLTLGSGFGKKVNGLDLPFYEVNDDYRAQIDSDLSRLIVTNDRHGLVR